MLLIDPATSWNRTRTKPSDHLRAHRSTASTRSSRRQRT